MMKFTARHRISVAKLLRRMAAEPGRSLYRMEPMMGIQKGTLRSKLRPEVQVATEVGKKIQLYLRAEGYDVPLRACLFLNEPIGRAVKEDSA
jgi:hypothetical protein